MEHESGDGTNGNWNARYNPQMIGKETERLGNERTRRDYPAYSIIKIGQNTMKKLGDLRRLSLKLQWKIIS